MKNLFKNLMLVAVAAMTFTACTETNEEVNAVSKSTTITFTADFGDTTRVAITDEDNDGKYKSSWEAGDQVVFAVYPDSETDNYYPIEVVGPFTIEDNCDRAEFTVTFTEIAEGNEIRAFLNYTFYDYLQNGYVVLEPMYISSQCPLKDTFENVCASAEVTYAGQEFNALQFSHDFAYAKMTINNLPTDCAWVSVKVNNSRNYSLDPENVENGVFWFMCDECLDVKSLDVTAAFGEYYSDDYRELCFSRTFGDEDNFEFKKGKISKFTITQLLSKLDSPYVTSVVNGNIATITWEAVNGADKYYVTVGDADAVEVTGTSYAIDLSEYEPLSTLSVYVVASGDGFANSNRSSVSVKVPASREYLDTWANDVEEFTFMRAVTSAADGVSVNNAYLFTKSEMSGKPTKNDFFMYLAFNNNVDFTQSGVYTINDLNYAYCNIWMPDNQLNGYSGYYNNYGLSWMPYHFYPNDGDIYQVFVDADGEETTITLYASCSWWNSIHFKGTWTGKLGGSVEPEPEPEEVAIVSAVATTPADISFSSATVRDVTFTYNNGDVLMMRFATLGKDYIVPGTWQTDDHTSPNYITVMQFNGNNIGLASTPFTVGYESGAYTFAGSIYVSYSPVTTMDFSYTGAVENLVKPVIEGGGESGGEPETSFTYLGRSYDLDSNPETNGGDYVYSVKSEDFDFTIGLYWSYANADGTIKDGTYNYCYNALNAMYSGWEGFVIVDDTYHYGSTLTVSGSKITLTLYTNDNLVGVYVYDGSNGGGVEPEQPGGGESGGGDQTEDDEDYSDIFQDGTQEHPYIYKAAVKFAGSYYEIRFTCDAEGGKPLYLETNNSLVSEIKTGYIIDSNNWYGGNYNEAQTKVYLGESTITVTHISANCISLDEIALKTDNGFVYYKCPKVLFE